MYFLPIKILFPYAIYQLDTVINQTRFLESLYSVMYKNRQSTISKDFFSLFSQGSIVIAVQREGQSS